MEPFETFEHAGMTVHLCYDMDPTSPDDWDTFGRLATAHSRYTFQDDLTTHPAYARGGGRLFERYVTLTGGAYIPVSMGDHSGIWLYEGHRAHECDPGGWDSGPVGYIWADAEAIAREGFTIEEAEKCLRGELRTWDDYVQGRVCGYVVEDPTGETIDSCWGFYPDDDDSDGLEYVRAEAREAAEAEADERKRAADIGIETRA